MYSNHVPYLAREIHAHHSVFKRAVIFAALSARVRFARVPDLVRDVDRNGADAAALWSWKGGTYNFMEEHAPALHLQLLRAGRDTAHAMHIITRVPGMGPIKGAFVLQMMGHDIACLDTRNTARLGIDMDTFDTHGRPVTQKTITRYMDVAAGRAQELWDVWCEDVAEDSAMSAERISALHLDCILPGWKALKVPTTQWLCPVYPHIPMEVPYV